MSLPTGYVLWEGRSQLDGTPIVVIATVHSENVKTGDMVQTWIIPQALPPTDVVAMGLDESICGDCPLRGNDSVGRSCYVNQGQAPNQVWRTYRSGGYPRLSPDSYSSVFAGRELRIGSYGDPCAAPYSLWEELVHSARSHAGYTHQWRRPEFRQFRQIVMASCESIGQAAAAQRKGWRTFRAMVELSDKLPHETLCPASNEAGNRTTCDKCTLCNGASNRRSVAIVAHGTKGKIANFRRLIQLSV